VAVLAAACSSGGAPVARGPAVTTPAAPLIYVAVGASETVGYGADDPLTQAWPQVLFHTALPVSTVFTNLGIPGETVAGALTDELPEALSLHPDVVTVWLNVNDALALVPVATYQEQLQRLVTALRAGGRTRVFVANTPPLSQLPAYLACIRPGSEGRLRCQIPDPQILPQPSVVDADVASYNTAISTVAARTGAVLVDLHALGVADEQAGRYASFIGHDGFHPSTSGHAQVAAAFAAAVKQAGISPTPPVSRPSG
jgi:lysophospholipase L1-like esterase